LNLVPPGRASRRNGKVELVALKQWIHAEGFNASYRLPVESRVELVGVLNLHRLQHSARHGRTIPMAFGTTGWKTR
jgi:hypothetical protein